MLVTSANFTTAARRSMRQLTWALTISFEKTFNYGTSYFTLDSSTLNSDDILAPDQASVISEWDKYSYRDYSKRVVSLEWQRELTLPYSVSLALGDITLNNYDKLFTYGTSAPAESLSDNFNLGFNADKWGVWNTDAVKFVGGQVQMNAGTAPAYYGMNAIYAYDLSNSYFSIQVINAGTQSVTQWEVVPLQIVNLYDRGDAYKFSIIQNTLRAYRMVGNNQVQLASVTYSTTNHKFVRIRGAGNTIYWEYSANGTTWTSLYSEPQSFDSTLMEAQVLVGMYATSPSKQTATFDNFNTNASGVPLSSVTASPIAAYVLPRRPVRIQAGFSGENLPQFIGLTDGVPKTDKPSGTATLHVVDFLSYLFTKPIGQAVILQNKRTDEVLAYLLQLVGVPSDQYDLDTGLNVIPFVYFDSTTNFGDAIKELMEAELGNFGLDENGTIRFQSRLKSTSTPVYSFDKSNIIDYSYSDESSLINSVHVKANVREVQPTQNIYSLSAPSALPTGMTDLFFNFDNPVVAIDPISVFSANSSDDGSGTDLTANVSIASYSLFATSIKVTFNNTGAPGWLTTLLINGKPALVTKTIDITKTNDSSVAQFEEQATEIDNDLIQSSGAANAVADTLLQYYGTYSSIIELNVKGTPALQLGDTINVTLDGLTKKYVISKIANRLDSGGFGQRLTARTYNIPTLFTLNTSVLNSPDVLTP